MKKIVLALGLTLALFSCTKEKIRGNGAVISSQRNHTGFTGIEAIGSSPVFITQGAVFSVEVKGYETLVPYFETSVTNNKLRVGYRNNVNVKNDNIQVFVTMPVLNDISLHGSCQVTTTGVFAGNTNFNAFISGSGNINFSSGTTQNFYSHISGSGNIYMLNMISDKAEANISGSGNTEITANNQLKVNISGSGNVYFRGAPVITTTISGSGAVIPK